MGQQLFHGNLIWVKLAHGLSHNFDFFFFCNIDYNEDGVDWAHLRGLIPCMSWLLPIHSCRLSMSTNGKFKPVIGWAASSLRLYELRRSARLKYSGAVCGCMVGMNVRSADPATLLINFSMNRYESSELECSTAKTIRKRGVTSNIDFDIDWDGIWSIIL